MRDVILKKLLSFVLVIIVVSLLVAGTAVPAMANEDTYDVGYARVDINPYIVDGDLSSGIMQLPLRGSGDVWNRLSTKGLLDDNGDGVTDENDGLKVTCIAVTDSDDKTVLFITIDLIGGGLYSKISAEIMTRVEAALASGELSNVNLTKEQIFFAGTHTHNAPDTSVYASAGKTGTNDDGVELSFVNENLGKWIDRTVVHVGEAAIAALMDRAPATVVKDQIAVSDATSEAVAGKVLNSTRHYNAVDHETGEKFVIGDNFNGTSTSAYNTSRGDDPQQVTEVDDTMYLLKFSFEDPTKLPIIFAGWRGHPSLNNSNDYANSSKNAISSDFVNAFRHAVEYGCNVTTDQEHPSGYVKTWTLGTQRKYRVAYFQGNGGNVNPRGYELMRDEAGNVITYGDSNTQLKAYSWIDLSGKNAVVNGNVMGRACSFGVVLSQLAAEGITDGKNETPVCAGPIKTIQKSFISQRKTDGVDALSYNAAVAYQKAAVLQADVSADYTAANTAYKNYVSAYNACETARKNYENASALLQWMYKPAYDDALAKRNAAKETYDAAMSAYQAKMDTYIAFMTANSTNDPVTEVADAAFAVSPDKAVLSLPFIYKSEDGKIHAIASRFHANAIVNDWNAKLNIPKTSTSTVKLNAILLGEDLAFVVVPGEPFDYYYKEPDIYTPENNLWNELVNEASYGKPMVIGYANNPMGYFPNYEAYEYSEGSQKWAVGSYEVHTSDFAKGTGEEMIRQFKYMLSALEAESKTAYCSHCKTSVSWQPYMATTPLSSGHYYLTEDYSGAQTQIAANAQVCFDLNGFTFTGDTRAFYTNDGCEFSLMDNSEAQTGVARGSGGPNGASLGFGGGSMIVNANSVVNFYSGTLAYHERPGYSVTTGGVLRVTGTFNMYGGTIEGGIASSFQGQYLSSGKPTEIKRTTQGGTVVVNGIMRVYGGRIKAGRQTLITGTCFGDDTNGYGYSYTTEPLNTVGACVYVVSKKSLTVAGNANIDDIYYPASSAAYFTIDASENAFTGTAQLSLKTAPVNGDDIGNYKGSKGISGAVTLAGNELRPAVDGTDLRAVQNTVDIYRDTELVCSYASMASALNAYTYDASIRNYIRLNATSAEPLSVSATTYLDLNGFDLTGDIFVADGAVLYCMDSKTNDYTVSDANAYGLLKGKLTGTVLGVPADTVSACEDETNAHRAGYLKVIEAEGASFHRVNLQITGMALRPGVVGVYYTSHFRGDEVVAGLKPTFGIALSVVDTPTADTMQSQCMYSAFTDFQSGKNGNAASSTGVLLRNIMIPGQKNAERAQIRVYGRAYLFAGGEYLFGSPVDRTLAEQVLAIDRVWDTLTQQQKTAFLGMYAKYADVLDTWDIPKIREDYRKVKE